MGAKCPKAAATPDTVVERAGAGGDVRDFNELAANRTGGESWIQ